MKTNHTNTHNKVVKAIATAIATIIGMSTGFYLIGWALGFHSIWFRVLIGVYGLAIVLNILLRK